MYLLRNKWKNTLDWITHYLFFIFYKSPCRIVKLFYREKNSNAFKAFMNYVFLYIFKSYNTQNNIKFVGK